MSDTNDLLDRVLRLKLILLSRSRNELADDSAFVTLRSQLMREPRLKGQLPRFLNSCTTLSEFWSIVKKPRFEKYAEREAFLRDEFQAVIDYLEGSAANPSDATSSAILSKVDSAHVRSAWQKALDRRQSDADGAITVARTLIEAVCKHILTETATPYDESWDLIRLYGETARQLDLAPDKNTEPILRQVLSGCHTVIQGLAGLRNHLSDAHGKSPEAAGPDARHAEFAVNLAGTVATFLIATYEAHGITT